MAAKDPRRQCCQRAPTVGLSRARGFRDKWPALTISATERERGLILHPTHVGDEATTDQILIELWLDGRSRNTRRSYAADVRSLLTAIRKPITALTPGDLEAWAESLSQLAPASRARKIGAVKSLLRFGERRGDLPSNIGAALRAPAVKRTLANRILDRQDVLRLIAFEPNPRNHALRRLGYIAGLRVSEICSLRWCDAQARPADGHITAKGQGGKSRHIVLPRSMWNEHLALRGNATDEEPVFRSARGGAIDSSQIHRILKRAASRAGLPSTVSPYYLRHAHISHALERGASARLVQLTVGHSDVRLTRRYDRSKSKESSATYLSD